MSSAIVQLLSAEILLVAVAVAIFLLGAFLEAGSFWNGLALGGLVMAAALWFSTPVTHGQMGPLLMDPLARFVGWFAIAMGILLVALTWRHTLPEYTGSLLLTLAGLMIAGTANELVLLFLGLELISIPTYVLLYLGRRGAASQEATVKYFYLSILSSAPLLYGFSFLYGTTGSTNLETIRATLAAPAATAAGLGSLAKVAMLLILAGLGFKMAAVPFQFYAPDVYQGTSNPNAALLSIIPKAAGLVVLVRIVLLAMPDLQHYGWHVVLLVSVLTMTFGNVMGLWQDNVRRLLAYSSIAHTGYMLLAVAVAMTGAGMAAWNGVGAMLFYLCVYALATIGALAGFEYLGHGGRQLDGVDELAGLSRTQPLLAAALAVCLFSLTGIPPVAGFWGKLAIFASALAIHPGTAGPGNLGWWFLMAAIVGVLNSAVGAAYYLRIVAVMYFRAPLARPRPEGGAGPYLTALAAALLVIVVGVQSRPLMEAAMKAGPQAGVDSGRWTVDGERGRKERGRRGERGSCVRRLSCCRLLTLVARPVHRPTFTVHRFNMARPRSSVTELAVLFNSAKQPVYVLDERLTIVFCNSVCLQWLGQSESELLGRRCVWHSSPDVPPADAVAAALCPPPAVLYGNALTASVAMAGEEYPARFVPLGGGEELGGILAIIDTALALPETPELALAEEPSPAELHRQLRRFRQRWALRYRLDRLLGESPGARRARAQAELAAGSRASVLLVGPPGSGRQYVARAIHYGGDPGATGALVPLACAALGPELIESTVRAAAAKLARDEKRGRHTLLLNDVEELPVESQRVLAELLAPAAFPLRLIATAQRSPREIAEPEPFLPELAGLLSTLVIELPPLAARRQDLPLLAQAFLEDVNAQGEKQLLGFTPEALDCLDEYPWPGNLDELAQMVAEAHQRAAGALVTVADLPQRIHLAAEAAAHPRRKEETIVLDEFLGRVETELIRRALARAKGNKAKAARLLGVTRPRLYRRMVQLGVVKEGRG